MCVCVCLCGHGGCRWLSTCVPLVCVRVCARNAAEYVCAVILICVCLCVSLCVSLCVGVRRGRARGVGLTSWRGSTTRMPFFSQETRMGLMWPPTSVNTNFTLRTTANERERERECVSHEKAGGDPDFPVLPADFSTARRATSRSRVSDDKRECRSLRQIRGNSREKREREGERKSERE